MINYIFIGPPGSGKGTQAKLLAEKINGYFFGMGDELRKEVKRESELGLKFKKIWDKKDGSLIPNELVSQLFQQRIKNAPKDKVIVIDGYPRFVEQAEAFEKALPNFNYKVISIIVKPGLLVDRMSTRKICEKCSKVFFRPDDSGITICDNCGGKLITRFEDQPDIIEKRINVYNKETKPLIEYYRNKNMIIDINGNPPIDDVKNEIWEKLNVK